MEWTQRRRQWSAAVFLFWSALDLAAGDSLGLWELSALWLFGELLLWFCREGEFSPRRAWCLFLHRVSPAGGCLLLLGGAYLGLELCSLLWSPVPGLALPKYPAVAVMALGGAGTLLFLEGRRGRVALLAAVGAAGILAALLSWLPAVFPQLPAFYRLRLSLRVDYNTFGQVVLLSGAAASCALLAGGRKDAFWAGAGIWAICLPAVFLSASRRCLLLAPAVVGVVLWAAAREKVRPGVLLGTAAAGGLGAWAATVLLRHGLERRPLGPAELSAGARYAAMADGSFAEKRLAIWEEGFRELSGYTPAQWIFGKGAGWNIRLYDARPMPRLEALYGGWEEGTMSVHNFLLADLLDGGLLRLLAGVLLLLMLAVCLWGVPRPAWERGFLLCCLGVSGFSCLISNRYGLLGDRFFWIGGILSMALPLAHSPKEASACENPLCDDQRPSPRRCADLPPGSPSPGPGGVAGGDPQPGV